MPRWLILPRTGGDLDDVPVVTVRRGKESTEGALDRLSHVGHPRSSPGPSGTGESFIRAGTAAGQDVVRADEVVRPGLLHPQVGKCHPDPCPIQGARVPDGGRCLRRLLRGAEV